MTPVPLPALRPASAASSTALRQSGATSCGRTTRATLPRSVESALSIPFIDYARGDGLASARVATRTGRRSSSTTRPAGSMATAGCGASTRATGSPASAPPPGRSTPGRPRLGSHGTTRSGSSGWTSPRRRIACRSSCAIASPRSERAAGATASTQTAWPVGVRRPRRTTSPERRDRGETGPDQGGTGPSRRRGRARRAAGGRRRRSTTSSGAEQAPGRRRSRRPGRSAGTPPPRPTAAADRRPALRAARRVLVGDQRRDPRSSCWS